MDAMGSADLQRILVLHGDAADDSLKLDDAADDQFQRIAQQERKGRVHDIV